MTFKKCKLYIKNKDIITIPFLSNLNIQTLHLLAKIMPILSFLNYNILIKLRTVTFAFMQPTSNDKYKDKEEREGDRNDNIYSPKGKNK